VSDITWGFSRTIRSTYNIIFDKSSRKERVGKDWYDLRIAIRRSVLTVPEKVIAALGKLESKSWMRQSSVWGVRFDYWCFLWKTSMKAKAYKKNIQLPGHGSLSFQLPKSQRIRATIDIECQRQNSEISEGLNYYLHSKNVTAPLFDSVHCAILCRDTCALRHQATLGIHGRRVNYLRPDFPEEKPYYSCICPGSLFKRQGQSADKEIITKYLRIYWAVRW